MLSPELFLYKEVDSMNKYRVAVYAISKNEEKFADKWLESMREADEIYVTDTGSEDRTVEKLRKGGVKVQTIRLPKWRFDTARNISLSYVPMNVDICVCTDLDELFEKGWRQLLENAWTKNTSRLKYTYTWSFNTDGSPGTVFMGDKIHSRKGFRWVYPVHEVLMYESEKPYHCVSEPEIHLNHYPDALKPRSQYLELLFLAVKENPDNDRNVHYLGRELMYYGKWNKSIEALKMHLKMPSAQWKEERAASMRYIARCYKALKNYKEAESWLYKAIAEAPYVREAYMEMAFLAYELRKWPLVYGMTAEALSIKEKSMTYINESFCWDFSPYDMAAVSAFNLGMYKRAYQYVRTALEIAPKNERLINNERIIRKYI